MLLSQDLIFAYQNQNSGVTDKDYEAEKQAEEQKLFRQKQNLNRFSAIATERMISGLFFNKSVNRAARRASSSKTFQQRNR